MPRFRGGGGGTGGQFWTPLQNHKAVCFLGIYWYGTPGKSQCYPVSIQSWAIIGTPAERHLKGVLLGLLVLTPSPLTTKNKKNVKILDLWGIILAQNDDGPLKWANGPHPIKIHANSQILMGQCRHLKFLWALCKIWWAQESLISSLEHNWHEIWIACIWGPAKNKVHFSKPLIVFSQKGSGPF